MADMLVVRSREGQAYRLGNALFKVGGSQTGGRFDFMVMDVEHRSGPPLHVHEAQDDTFYVLSGVLTLQAGDEVLEIGPGDFATVPPGVAHTFDNLDAAQGPVRVVNIMTPGGYDELFKEWESVTANPLAEEVVAIYARHGARPVGPPLRDHLDNSAG
ncbi:cupin domain-containing protein [Pseudonocardia sp. TRM90224]|uniref:cupin domain-containing protein n=1 Tax=Pseudonocardia sp. TRM90224 TaxID=2812678 RepID=UPI001E465C30|nr:cupin domain-containing protein [Pseudonocardia sp. TRM90224]